MKFLTLLLSFLTISESKIYHNNTSPNGCISFTVSSGTGCAWMCNYCYENLKTTNYYFTDGVCKYQTGGCVGNPQTNHLYTCCSN
jgi:hypothetical protein